MLNALEILEPPAEPVYFCPGELSSVSRAVHRARLAAHWPGCHGCPSRDDGKDWADSTTQTRRLIRRTEWGIRGAWQNALTRQKASQLIGVVTGHLLNQLHDADAISGSDVASDSVSNRNSNAPTLIMGYDGRASSPDIFAGIVSATLQNGLHVIDAGRSTAASIQETCRSITHATFGVIVTGAGESSSVTGFDIFDTRGQAISIPWQSWGIRVRRFHEDEGSMRSVGVSHSEDAMARLKHSIETDEFSSYPSPTIRHSVPEMTTLELPRTVAGSGGRYRVSRRSGMCQSIDAESAFCRWLAKWFPESITTRVACICFDPLTAERLEWLFSEAGVALDVIDGVASRSGEEQISQRVQETHSQWGICIEEDDRYMTVCNQHGHCLSAEELSEWINQTFRTIRPHVTTHVPAGEDRIVLLDAGRPNQADAHDVISDSVAVMGCICRIVQSGTALPRPGWTSSFKN